uniref:Uncharacterized protein n=1 Tax=Cannabis sativa TaxID=3483 RepID=A0A803PKT1_CANSA
HDLGLKCPDLDPVSRPKFWSKFGVPLLGFGSLIYVRVLSVDPGSKFVFRLVVLALSPGLSLGLGLCLGPTPSVGLEVSSPVRVSVLVRVHFSFWVWSLLMSCVWVKRPMNVFVSKFGLCPQSRLGLLHKVVSHVSSMGRSFGSLAPGPNFGPKSPSRSRPHLPKSASLVQLLAHVFWSWFECRGGFMPRFGSCRSHGSVSPFKSGSKVPLGCGPGTECGSFSRIHFDSIQGSGSVPGLHLVSMNPSVPAQSWFGSSHPCPGSR